MSDEELANWGRQENALRKSEMANVKSEQDLKRVQAACAARRKLVGLSAGQAAVAVVVGQRIDRGESLEFAIRAACR